MDYIYQELLRQRAVLARLLLGSGKEREEQRVSAGTAERPADLLEESGGWKDARYWAFQTAWPAGNGAVFTEDLTGGGAFGVNLKDGGEAALGRMDSLPAGEEPAAQKGGHRPGKTTAASARRWPFSDADGGEQTERALWLRLETGERSDEKALSRMVQRDARRYDGGFSLY